MKSQVCIPVETNLLVELIAFLRKEQDVRDPAEVVEAAIRYFLENAAWKQSDLLVTRTVLGYQWKNLFLPDGTQLRMQYKGKYFYARVEGDKVIYEGAPVSPASLVNSITGTSRNAWRDLWIHRPGDDEWKFADECRRDEEAADSQKMTPSAP